MSDVDCDSFHSSSNITDICAFVRNTSACDIDEGFINYTDFVYCDLGNAVAAACIILLIWWLFLFCGLAVTADDYFCPALSVISKNLRLSHNVAGVTFLAFGNGAPDIFSAIAAIGNAKAGDAGLAIGALFGAGVFVTAIVAGSIAIICPFASMERPFLRDVIFYLAAVYWAWHVMWDKKITQYEAIGFIALYLFYVLVVIVGRYINQKFIKSPPLKTLTNVVNICINGRPNDSRPFADDEPKELGTAYRNERQNDPEVEMEIQNSPAPNERPEGLWALLWHDVNPIDVEEWKEKKVYSKVYDCFKSPLVFLLNISVPVVGEPEDGDEMRNWNRLLNSIHVFTGPTFSIFVTKLGFNTIGGVFPVWALVMIVCFFLAILVFFTTKTDKRPPYHTAFAYLGFLVSVVWIYSVANEIVNALQALGVVVNVSDAILGLTLLAWGNSIGDLIADTTMARHGYPRMGISACFGGPLFNLLLGLGIPFTLACFKRGKPFELEVDLEEMILAGGLALSLLVSLIVVPLSKFRMSRPYGILLVVVYVSFLLIAILTELDVIPNKKL